MNVPEQIGPYAVERLLGEGVTALVVAATHADGAPVAIKWPASAAGYRPLENEIRCLQKVQHPGLVRFLGHGVVEGRPYMVMERILGMSLRAQAPRLRDLPPVERHRRIRELARQACEALGYLHQRGWVHRDLKPDNILVDQTGRLVITDFGVAQEIDEEDPFGPDCLVGTLAYAAPELLSRQSLPEGDQYSLGCTLYFLACGQPPFLDTDRTALIQAHLQREPKPPSFHDPTLPVDLEAFLLRLMAKDPTARFPDMEAAAASVSSEGPAGLPLSGRQATIELVAASLEEVAAGRTVVLRLLGYRGSGRSWTTSLAQEAAARRGLACVSTDDASVLTRVRARPEATLIVTSLPVEGPDVSAHFLGPLSLAELRRSLYSLAPATVELSQAAERLHRETGGNPGLFLKAVEKYKAGDALALPDGPLEVDVSLWVDGLDVDELTVAGALAFFTHPAPIPQLTEIAQVPAEAVLPALEARALAVPVGEEWRLSAEILRRPLQELQFDPEGLQERIAALEALSPRPEPDALLQEATDYRQAGDVESAERLLSIGVEEPGIAADRRAERLLLYASLRWARGLTSEAFGAYARALGLASRPALRARARIGMGVASVQVGHLAAALEALGAAASEAALAQDHRREALALINLSEVRSLAGQLAGGLTAARRGVVLVEGLRDQRLECIARRHLGQALLDVGMAEEAGRALADASTLARAASLQTERFAAHTLRAMATLDARPKDRLAASSALERLLPLYAEPQTESDPEGFRLLMHCVAAIAAARMGDARLYVQERQRADPSLAGQRILVRLRAELWLAQAALDAGDVKEALTRGERVHVDADLRGVKLLAWRASRLLARARGLPVPGPGALADGLEPAVAARFAAGR